MLSPYRRIKGRRLAAVEELERQAIKDSEGIVSSAKKHMDASAFGGSRKIKMRGPGGKKYPVAGPSSAKGQYIKRQFGLPEDSYPQAAGRYLSAKNRERGLGSHYDDIIEAMVKSKRSV